MGRQVTRTLFASLVLGAFAAIAVFAVAGWIPITTLFCGFLLPVAAVPIRILNSRTDGPALIRALKATARLHLWVGVILAAAVAFTP
jgi:1,4-dihydroxy-2-naphthoate octaprenyltransferase